MFQRGLAQILFLIIRENLFDQRNLRSIIEAVNRIELQLPCKRKRLQNNQSTPANLFS